MKGYNAKNIANFIRIDKEIYSHFNKSGMFKIKIETKCNIDNLTKEIKLYDLSSLSTFLSNNTKLTDDDQLYIEFVKNYPVNKLFFVFCEQNVYSAAKFVEKHNLCENILIRKFESIEITPFNVDKMYLNKFSVVNNLSSLFPDGLLLIKIKNNRLKKESVKKKKSEYLKERRNQKKAKDKRMFENDLRLIEYEIMMNGRILTTKYNDEVYEKYVDKIIEKYNRIHPNNKINKYQDNSLTKVDLSQNNYVMKKIIDNKLSNYVPKTYSKEIYDYGSLLNEDFVGRIELIESISSYNKHYNHEFEQNGVVKKFAYQNGNKINFVELSIFYCKTCNTYFDYLESYKSQLRKAGIPIKSMIATHLNQNGVEYYFDSALNWSNESKLKRYGYSVGLNGKSTIERRKLLLFLISSKIMTVYEVKKYLNQFISYNGQKYGNEYAKEDWKDDLLFVNDYLITK